MKDWNVLPDLVWYRFTLAYVLLQFAAVAWWSRKATRPPVRATRPPWDPTWFVPVYIWGLESLFHAFWWIYGAPLTSLGRTAFGFLVRLEFSGVVMLLTLCGCLLAESCAKRAGLASRTTAGTVPIPVLAAILGVHWTWLRITLAFVPVRWP